MKSRNLDLKTSHLIEFISNECKIYNLNNDLSEKLFKELNSSRSSLDKNDKLIL